MYVTEQPIAPVRRYPSKNIVDPPRILPGVRQFNSGALGILDIPGVDDLNKFIKKAEQVIDNAPAAMKAIPGIQRNTEFIQQAVPIVIGAVLVLAVAIVMNK